MLLVSRCGSWAHKSRLGAVAWGPAALRCSSQQTGRIGLGLLLHGHGVGSRGPRRWCECQALAVGSGILVPEDLLSVPSPESPNLWSHCYHRWSPLQTCTPHLPTKARPAPPPSVSSWSPGSRSPGGVTGGHCVLGRSWAGPLLCPWHVGRQWGWPWAGPWRPPPHLEGASALGDPQQHVWEAPG